MHPFVRIKTSAGETLCLVVATAAHGIVLADDCLPMFPSARRIGISRGTMGREDMDYEEYRVTGLNWGNHEASEINVSVIPRNKCETLVGSGLDGLLGYEAFAGNVVRIDFLRRELTVLPCSMAQNISLIFRPLVRRDHHLLLNGNIMGRRCFISINTGTPLNTIDIEYAREAGLQIPPNTVLPSRVESTLISIPHFTLDGLNADGIYCVVRPIPDSIKGRKGTIGSHTIMKAGGITIDYGAETLAFHHASFQETTQYCQSAAKTGAAWAWFTMYAERLSHEPTPYEEAFGMLKTAAEGGDQLALYTLGLAYQSNEWGLPRNPEMAFTCLSQAARMGFVPAKTRTAFCYLLGRGTNRNPSIGLKLLEESAMSGDIDAQAELGMELTIGSDEVFHNYSEGVNWLRRASVRGSIPGTLNLGVCYYKGLGVDRNAAEAFRLYLSAAEGGDDIAMCNVAAFYEKGIDREVDLDKAIEWYEKAARLKSNTAIEALRRLKYR